MDRTSQLLSSYACRLSYEDLSPATVHQIKRTVVDTFGCAIGGYLSEPAKIARRLAAGVNSVAPSRIIGTGDYSSMDLAGFANGVMVRYLDCNDSYFSPGGGHPSDMIPAALAVGDTLSADGPSLITAIALAYEVFCRISDEVPRIGLGPGHLQRHRRRLCRRQADGPGRGADGPRHFPGGGPQHPPARDPHG